MKHYQLWAVSAIACLALASCGNDDTVQGDGSQGEKELKGLTEFAVKVTEQPTATRTTGLYTGSRIDFYWTKDDRLWVNNTATSTLIQSTRDNINSQLIAGGVTKVPTAKFYFPGTYTEATYPVRYTGYGNNAGDKVTIKAAQAQTTPNDGSHIGADGDCGTAIANRGGDGKYTFTLLHKAAYLTFTPYYSHGFADDVKVTQIKVTANEALAGEFDFDDSGTRPCQECGHHGTCPRQIHRLHSGIHALRPSDACWGNRHESVWQVDPQRRKKQTGGCQSCSDSLQCQCLFYVGCHPVLLGRIRGRTAYPQRQDKRQLPQEHHGPPLA